MKNDSTVTEPGLSSIRNTDARGASTAWATRVLIGVTWLTTTTVLPACASRTTLQPGQHALLHGAEGLPCPTRGDVEGAKPGVEVGLVLLGDLDERQPVPGPELHLGEARLLLERVTQRLGKDLRGLAGAAYR